MSNERTPESCCWGEKLSGTPEIENRPVYYWCNLNNTPCRYATRCEYEEKENNDGETTDMS